MATTKIKVFVADDIPAIRENIKKLISFHPEIEVVGEAGGAHGFVRRADFVPDHLRDGGRKMVWHDDDLQAVRQRECFGSEDGGVGRRGGEKRAQGQNQGKSFLH